MDPSPHDIAALQSAFTAGHVYLVDEHARPLTLGAALNQRCWAHLRDAQDAKVYVHELKGSRELFEPRYFELLGLSV